MKLEKEFNPSLLFKIKNFLMLNIYNSIPFAGSVFAIIYLTTEIFIAGYLLAATFLIFLGTSFFILFDCMIRFGWQISVEVVIHLGQVLFLLFYLFLMALIVVTGF